MKGNFEIITNLQYENKNLRAQVDKFRSGEKYAEMNDRLNLMAVEKNMEIKRLSRKLADANSTLVTMREKWQEVFEDIEKAHKKELAKKDAVIEKLDKKVLKTERERDEAKDKLREKNKELYEALTALEEEQDKNRKLKAQLNRDYENSSIPSSMKPNRKKITNNREKTGRKPGGQRGHKGHVRKKHIPTNKIFIPAPEEFLDAAKYRPTGKMISKQVVNLEVRLVVDEYTTPEYRKISSGQRVHAAFPEGVANEVHYGGSVKAFAWLLNNHCMVSIDKVCDFLSEITNGQLQISKGMVNGLGEEFARKAEPEKRKICSELLRSLVMNVDFATIKVNGKNVNSMVCANPDNVVYYAREHKGHAGVKGTVLEDYLGDIVHDHDKTFYNYGDRHQECMAHVLRYLTDSIENESGLKWNRQMRALIREMIHYRNGIPPDCVTCPKKVEKFEARYREILLAAKSEYEYEPPSKYYREGYNLYKRMDKYMDSHLLFLHDMNVPATNNLSERLLRVLKRKSKQVMSFRSFDNLEHLCSGMSIVASLRSQNKNLYKSIADIFN